ncbi:MAG: CBS domain-containing protein [Desulfobulbaceae bacterium]|jgi:CBS domain-containing protein|nr:CBS domain-containing protein [Desulfobulbaceae bacterium]
MKKAREIMNSQVITAAADMKVVDLAKLFVEHDIGGAPVVDLSGKVVGVVTESDLIDQNKKLHIPTIMPFLGAVIFLESAKPMEKDIQKMAGATVADICSTRLVTVDAGDSLETVATVMSEEHCHTLPVMEDGELVGVIGKADIIRVIARSQ